MRPSLAVASLAAALTLLALSPSRAVAASPRWQAVPGDAQLEIELASLRLQGGQASAWLRTAASGGDRWPAPAWARHPGSARSAGLLQFDCRHRSARVLATVAWDRQGAVLQASDLPGPLRHLAPSDPLLPAYDALCELARSAS